MQKILSRKSPPLQILRMLEIQWQSCPVGQVQERNNPTCSQTKWEKKDGLAVLDQKGVKIAAGHEAQDRKSKTAALLPKDYV
jgi:hypothetical protein